MNSRIYIVMSSGQKSMLVRASSASQALRIAVNPRFTVKVASQDDLVALTREGVKVEEGE